MTLLHSSYQIFDHFSLFDETLLNIELCNSVISTYSKKEIRQHFSNSAWTTEEIIAIQQHCTYSGDLLARLSTEIIKCVLHTVYMYNLRASDGIISISWLLCVGWLVAGGREGAAFQRFKENSRNHQAGNFLLGDGARLGHSHSLSLYHCIPVSQSLYLILFISVSLYLSLCISFSVFEFMYLIVSASYSLDLYLHMSLNLIFLISFFI